MNIKHIYWFSYFDNTEPSVRYRAIYPLEKFSELHNIPYTFVYPSYSFRNIFHFLKTYFSVLIFRKKNSVIVFQKIYSNGIYANALKFLLLLRKQNSVYDIDDAEYERRKTSTINFFIKKCSRCFTGSEALANYCKQFNKNVTILTSPVIEHSLMKQNKNAILTIGWIGYYDAHFNSLKTYIFHGLQKIPFHFKLVILGVKNQTEINQIKSELQDSNIVELIAPLDINWQDELSVYKLITDFDIGVAPLIDTEFNRAKSAFKLKQCLSCGIPVLASAVGENVVFSQENNNGFLCNSVSDFVEKIIFINELENEEYTKMSIAAKSCCINFSIENYCQTFIKSFP